MTDITDSFDLGHDPPHTPSGAEATDVKASDKLYGSGDGIPRSLTGVSPKLSTPTLTLFTAPWTGSIYRSYIGG